MGGFADDINARSDIPDSLPYTRALLHNLANAADSLEGTDDRRDETISLLIAALAETDKRLAAIEKHFR